MVKLSILLRRAWLSIALGVLLTVLIISCLVAPLGPRDLALLREHRARLETVRDRLLVANGELAERTQRLQSDDAYLQRLIRRELGYARADELIYRFPRSDPPGDQ
jgi:cell division protein FtsB